MYDILIIGAGVVGCAVARKLSQYQARIAVLEAAEDVADGASKANSGIVHAGFDARPGTKKAYYNVKGAGMYASLAREMNVPYDPNGALVLGFHEEDRAVLEKLLRQGVENGVKQLQILEKHQVLSLEPNVNPAVTCALYAPTSAVVSPYEMTIALAYHAAQNGVEFRFDTPVTALQREEEHWHVTTTRGDFQARAVINCAGVGAAKLHNLISDREVTIIPRRGEYYLLDHTVKCPFRHTMFQVPSKMGKGVLITPTAHGNALLGPSAEDIEDGLDTATTRYGLDFVLDKCRLTWPGVNIRPVITTFSGVRAHPVSDDFIIGPVSGAPEGAFEAIGIESPGLTAAPAIAEELGETVARFLKLEINGNFIPPQPILKPFAAMSDPERAEACRRNPDYGRIVCRCEVVTEAEIRDAIRRPVGARSIDAVKRRTRAGMGRCQGGFCSPRVMEILCEELHLSPLEITKCGGESRLLAGTLTDIAKEAQEHE
ncbi:MAG: NAD(P)/FAD-dependent oxidoreductase [Clostridiales bacterium]|nr:NAD(P)/FAD-dependent oxidoreductase [Clostridiales bacterium]